MSGKSTYLEDKILDWMAGTTFPAAPSAVYLALFTTQPADAGTGGTEVSGGAYARQTFTFGSKSNASGSGRQEANSGSVTFPTATANWGTVTSFGIYDASSAGNLLYVAALTTSLTVNTGNQVVFSGGALTVKEDLANECSRVFNQAASRRRRVASRHLFGLPA